MGSSSYRVAGCLLTLALLLPLPTTSANAQSNYQGDSTALPSEPANLIDVACEDSQPVIVSSELLGEPYFRVMATTVGSDLDAVRRVLPQSLLVSTNADFLSSTDDELYQLNLVWDLTKVNLDTGGVVTLNPMQQLSDQAVWGADPPHVEVQVVVFLPNKPTLKYHYFDGRGLNFPWAGIDASTFAGMEVAMREEDGPWMQLDGNDNFFGMVSPKALWVDPSSLKDSVLYTLRLTTPDGLVDYADIVVEEGGYRVSEYEGDRDGGDLSGGGPPSGNQPESGNSDGSTGDGVQESYGPDEITISGKRANDLANRQNSVVFDFGDTKVSIPSRQIQDLHLESNSYLNVKANREEDGSLQALVGTEEGLLDVSTTVSETGQNAQAAFTTGVVAVFALGAITALICGVALVVRRRGVRGARL